MTRETQAELFIRTVAELRDQERDRQTAQQRAQHRAKAMRFMQTFSNDRTDGALVSKPTAPAEWARPWA